MTYIISIDWGGTKTLVALIKNNSIVKRIKFHTPNSTRYILNELIEYIEVISTGIKKQDITKIIIGCPSPVDNKGNVLYITSLKGVKRISLKKVIERKFKIPTIIENDVKIQSLGEINEYPKAKSIFYLILGTGVGASLIYNKQLYKGLNSAMEFGHSIIVANGAECGCGNRGCLEAYCSGPGISQRFYKKYNLKLTPEQILKLAKKRDKQALAFLNDTGYYLGIGLANIINIFEPDVIILNGGITNFGNYIMKNALRTAKQNSLVNYKGKIVISKLKEHSSMYGAIYLSKN